MVWFVCFPRWSLPSHLFPAAFLPFAGAQASFVLRRGRVNRFSPGPSRLVR